MKATVNFLTVAAVRFWALSLMLNGVGTVVGVPSGLAWRLHLRPREVDVGIPTVLLHVKLHPVLSGVAWKVCVHCDRIREPCLATVVPVVLTRSHAEQIA